MQYRLGGLDTFEYDQGNTSGWAGQAGPVDHAQIDLGDSWSAYIPGFRALKPSVGSLIYASSAPSSGERGRIKFRMESGRPYAEVSGDWTHDGYRLSAAGTTGFYALNVGGSWYWVQAALARSYDFFDSQAVQQVLKDRQEDYFSQDESMVAQPDYWGAAASAFDKTAKDLKKGVEDVGKVAQGALNIAPYAIGLGAVILLASYIKR